MSSSSKQTQRNRQTATAQKCVNCSTDILMSLSHVQTNPTQVIQQELPPLTLKSPIPPDIFQKSADNICSKITYAQALSTIFILTPLDIIPSIYSKSYLCTRCASKLDTIFHIYAELCDIHDLVKKSGTRRKFEAAAGTTDCSNGKSGTNGSDWFSTLKKRADLLLDPLDHELGHNDILEDLKPDFLDFDCFDNNHYDEPIRTPIPIPDPIYDNSDTEIEKKNPNLQILTEALTRPCVIRVQRVDLNGDGQASPAGAEQQICSIKPHLRPRPWTRVHGHVRSKSRSSKGKAKKIQRSKPGNPRRLWDEIEPADLDPSSSSESDSDIKIKSKKPKLSDKPKQPRVHNRVRPCVKKPSKPLKRQSPPKYSCPRPECTFKCATRRKLLAHLTSATDGPDGQGHKEPPTLEICEWCKPLTIWPNSREYLSHIQSHANETGVPTCTECENPQVFPNKVRLHTHQLSPHCRKFHSVKHDTAKNFQCHLCPSSFKFQSSLDEHLLCHENERKWICSSFGNNVSCDNPRFNRKLHLVQHIIIVHQIERKEAGDIASRPESKTEEPLHYEEN